MKKRLILILILDLFAQNLYAHSDSLQISRLLEKANSKGLDSNFTLPYARQALKWSQEIDNKYLQGESYSTLALIYYYDNLFDKSIWHWAQAATIYENQKDTLKWANTERLIGSSFETIGYLDSSLKYINHALQLYKNKQDSIGISNCYLDIATVQLRLSLWREAKQTTKQSLAYINSDTTYQQLASAYQRLGISFLEMGQPDSARHYFLMEKKMDEKSPDSQSRLVNANTLGVLEFREKNFEKAKNHFQEAIQLAGGAKSPIGIQITFSLADCFLELNQLDSAKNCLKEINDAAIESNDAQILVKLFERLSLIEERSKNPELSLEYYKLYHYYSDSLLAEQYDETLREMETSIQLDVQRSINDELEKSKSNIVKLLNKNRKANYILLGLSTLLVSSIISLGINFKRLKKSKNQLDSLTDQLLEKSNSLERNNKHLETTIRFNKNLVSVIAHDLKHPFENIYSILQHVISQIKSETLQNSLKLASRLSNNGLILIKDLVDLSRSDYSMPILGEDNHAEFSIKTLIDQTISNYKVQLTAKNIHCHFNITDGHIITKEDHLYRIIDNLFSNALKYSPIDSDIWVSSKFENQKLILTIRDSGPGFSEQDMHSIYTPFSKLSARPTNGEPSSGLGLHICKKLATGLDGNLELISKPGDSAIFELHVPLQKNQMTISN